MGTIAIGYDGSKAAAEALRFGSVEAESRGDDVLVVQSWDDPVAGAAPFGEVWVDVSAVRDEVGRELREAVAEKAREHPSVAFALELTSGRPDRVLLEEAARVHAGMIVLGARGRGGFSSLLLGSVSRRVAAASSVPVVVVRHSSGDGDEIVVGVDGTADGRRALAWAADEAERRGLPLRAVLAWSYFKPQGPDGPEVRNDRYGPAEAEETLEAIVGSVLGEDRKLDVRLDAPNSLPAKALVDRSVNAALLVLGPQPDALHHHLDSGSVTLQVLHHAECPVAVIPPALAEATPTA